MGKIHNVVASMKSLGVWWEIKQINVSPYGDSRLVKPVKVHGLVYIALTKNTHLPPIISHEGKWYEKTIGEIAEFNLDNENPMQYIEFGL